jgi:hypothetical protein
MLGGKKPDTPNTAPHAKPTEGQQLADMLDAGSDGGIDFNPNEMAQGFDGNEIDFNEAPQPAPAAKGGASNGKIMPGEPGFVEWSNEFKATLSMPEQLTYGRALKEWKAKIKEEEKKNNPEAEEKDDGVFKEKSPEEVKRMNM